MPGSDPEARVRRGPRKRLCATTSVEFSSRAYVHASQDVRSPAVQFRDLSCRHLPRNILPEKWTETGTTIAHRSRYLFWLLRFSWLLSRGSPRGPITAHRLDLPLPPLGNARALLGGGRFRPSWPSLDSGRLDADALQGVDGGLDASLLVLQLRNDAMDVRHVVPIASLGQVRGKRIAGCRDGSAKCLVVLPRNRERPPDIVRRAPSGRRRNRTWELLCLTPGANLVPLEPEGTELEFEPYKKLPWGMTPGSEPPFSIENARATKPSAARWTFCSPHDSGCRVG